jgi:hypothetical protein
VGGFLINSGGRFTWDVEEFSLYRWDALSVSRIFLTDALAKYVIVNTISKVFSPPDVIQIQFPPTPEAFSACFRPNPIPPPHFE